MANDERASAAMLEARFETLFGEPAETIEAIRPDGSARRLFRLRGARRAVIGVYHEDREENEAFIGFSRHFRALGLPVPEIFGADPEEGVYFETDLGDESLASRLRLARETDRFPSLVLPIYRDAVAWLARFQALGAAGLDLSLCYQGREFDAVAMRRDLAYFRGSFLEPLCSFSWDRARLEGDFEEIVRFLDSEERRLFLYRDFQSRNILIVGESPFFIDYQSGRLGAPEYDLASLLYDGRAELGEGVRAELLEAYLDAMDRLTAVRRERFLRFLPGFALLRVLQALGAYGNLGTRRGNRYFAESIPYGLRNARDILQGAGFPLDLPELRRVIALAAEAHDAGRMPAS